MGHASPLTMPPRVTFPQLTRERWRGILIAVVIATFIRIMLQPLIPEGESVMEPSVIAEAGLLIPAFIVYALITYTFIAYSFTMFEAGLPWSRLGKGLAFGSLFALIWTVYLYEPVPLGEGVPFIDSIGYPLADGLSMVAFGLLLGRFVATAPAPGRRSWRPLSLLLAPAALLAVRLFEYNVLHIYSSYGDRTADTLVWVLALGLSIGLAYVVLRPGVPSATPAGRSLGFGLFFYGIPIMLVNFFVVLALKVDVADLVLRSALDVAAIVAAVYLAERWSALAERRGEVTSTG